MAEWIERMLSLGWALKLHNYSAMFEARTKNGTRVFITRTGADQHFTQDSTPSPEEVEKGWQIRDQIENAFVDDHYDDDVFFDDLDVDYDEFFEGEDDDDENDYDDFWLVDNDDE